MPKIKQALYIKELHYTEPEGPQTSGHAVNLKTFTNNDHSYIPWITKLNKHEGQIGVDASTLEVAFSQSATLFFRPGLTPPAKIVLSETGEVIGVASENFNVQIQKLREAGKDCYEFNSKTWKYEKISDPTADQVEAEKNKLESTTGETFDEAVVFQKAQLTEATKGVHFLDKLQRDFFPTLMGKYRKGEVDIDMDSLASVLTGSYALEEDDLHKGNIGFYVTNSADGSEKKKFTFFKIDHDLMFIDSIMSQRDLRAPHINKTKNSFKITVRDLDGFPEIKDSANHYFPTKLRAAVIGPKAYTWEETRAWVSLKNDTNFNNSKWKCFLKYSLLPTPLIEKSLAMHLDPNSDKDKIHMIHNSISSRTAQLKRTLLKSDTFLNYLKSDGAKAKEDILKEIKTYMDSSGISIADQTEINVIIENTFNSFMKVANTHDLSPLGKTIVLDCYKFSSAKPTDKEIELAMGNYATSIAAGDNENAFKNACIVIHLIEKTGDKDNINLKIVNDYKKDYLKPEAITTLNEFKIAADKIRRSELPLTQQKKELLAVLTEAKLSVDALNTLKQELQKPVPEDNSLKFINQLRSNLWFIRKIYGAYGNSNIRFFRQFYGAGGKKTTTSKLMVKEIDSKIAQLNAGKLNGLGESPVSSVLNNSELNNNVDNSLQGSQDSLNDAISLNDVSDNHTIISNKLVDFAAKAKTLDELDIKQKDYKEISSSPGLTLGCWLYVFKEIEKQTPQTPELQGILSDIKTVYEHACVAEINAKKGVGHVDMSQAVKDAGLVPPLLEKMKNWLNGERTRDDIPLCKALLLVAKVMTLRGETVNMAPGESTIYWLYKDLAAAKEKMAPGLLALAESAREQISKLEPSTGKTLEDHLSADLASHHPANIVTRDGEEPAFKAIQDHLTSRKDDFDQLHQLKYMQKLFKENDTKKTGPEPFSSLIGRANNENDERSRYFNNLINASDDKERQIWLDRADKASVEPESTISTISTTVMWACTSFFQTITQSPVMPTLVIGVAQAVNDSMNDLLQTPDSRNRAEFATFLDNRVDALCSKLAGENTDLEQKLKTASPENIEELREKTELIKQLYEVDEKITQIIRENNTLTVRFGLWLSQYTGFKGPVGALVTEAKNYQTKLSDLKQTVFAAKNNDISSLIKSVSTPTETDNKLKQALILKGLKQFKSESKKPEEQVEDQVKNNISSPRQ